MKNKKFAIVFCIHHKPWLIMSTILSTILQEFESYDIYLLYNKGSGEKYYNEHKDIFDQYNKLKKQFGKNIKLDDSFDPFLTKVCNLNNSNIFEVDLEDDHGLDSGAWYKFINSKKWKQYDYTFFMGEGALFTHNKVLIDTYQFMQSNNVNFISGASNKRYLSQKVFFDNFISKSNNNELNIFNDKMLKKTFDYYLQDKDFQKVYNDWGKSSITSSDFQEHHIPNAWGNEFFFYLDMFFSKLETRIDFIKIIRENLYVLKNNIRIFFFNFIINKRKKVLDKNFNFKICVNYKLKKLSQITEYKRLGNTNFHISSKIGSFGTHCNFVASNEILEKLSKKIDQYNIDLATKLPYAAGALEPIWSLIPRWLGYDLWFFDGIHRVFKNHFNNKRHDNPINMSQYINIYFKKYIITKAINKKIVIMKYAPSIEKYISKLNNYYFENNSKISNS